MDQANTTTLMYLEALLLLAGALIQALTRLTLAVGHISRGGGAQEGWQPTGWGHDKPELCQLQGRIHLCEKQ